MIEAKEILAQRLGESTRTKELVSLFEENSKNARDRSGPVVILDKQSQYLKPLLNSLNNEANEILAGCAGNLRFETVTPVLPMPLDYSDFHTVLRAPRLFWRAQLITRQRLSESGFLEEVYGILVS
jgi:hypothetical protein